MGRIEQAFTLAERFVGAYERYVDECTRRYRGMESEAAEAARNSARMTDSMASKVRADEDLSPRLADLTQQIAELAAHFSQFDIGSALGALRAAAVAALPNGDPQEVK